MLRERFNKRNFLIKCLQANVFFSKKALSIFPSYQCKAKPICITNLQRKFFFTSTDYKRCRGCTPCIRSFCLNDDRIIKAVSRRKSRHAVTTSNLGGPRCLISIIRQATPLSEDPSFSRPINNSQRDSLPSDAH